MAALVLDNCKKVRTALPDVKFYILAETLKEEFLKLFPCYICCYCWKARGDKMEIKEHDRKVIRHTPVCSLMCCVKPSYMLDFDLVLTSLSRFP